MNRVTWRTAMIKFLRIETRAGNPVAVFDRGYAQWEPTEGGGSRLDGGTFCLNEESLHARIANIEVGHNGLDRDTSVEREALQALLTAKREPE